MTLKIDKEKQCTYNGILLHLCMVLCNAFNNTIITLLAIAYTAFHHEAFPCQHGHFNIVGNGKIIRILYLTNE